jgi:hypothetical protein
VPSAFLWNEINNTTLQGGEKKRKLESNPDDLIVVLQKRN